jgi:hypothetical protein
MEAAVGITTTPDEEVPGPAPLPDLGNVPEAAAPLALSTTPLPADPAAITALWERLPPEVAGFTRSPQLDQIFDGRSRIGYGEDQRLEGIADSLLTLQALNSPQTNFFPTNWNAAHVIVARLNHEQEKSGEQTIKAGGRDGNLFWLREETFIGVADSDERFPVYALEWGTADSPWLFGAQADTPEHLDELVKAFIDAAQPEE